MVSVKVAVRIGRRWEREEKPELGEKWGKLKLILPPHSISEQFKTGPEVFRPAWGHFRIASDKPFWVQELNRSTTAQKMQVVNRNQTFVRDKSQLF